MAGKYLVEPAIMIGLDSAEPRLIAEGFLIAVGDRFQPNSRVEGGHILDLAPAVYTLLNAPKPVEMRGNASSIIRPG